MNPPVFKLVLIIGKIFSLVLLTSLSIPTCQAQDTQTLALRAVQSRTYRASQEKLTEAVISTLQDMGYGIDRINNTIGFVNATQYAHSLTEITITMAPIEGAITVRISARRNNYPLDDDPKFYQNFFSKLSQSTFLNEHKLY
ncbi:hypothetical protein COMNV_00776 [Commensalibacter sp. Nvir]|uniref:hypothetical protein n=1 Tax=Commensalibacter sp. Nvir TaxID=3069817 RepID=UPI002D708E80|nr:hypothetical protein COMNV_00776 [Commensalibacter sp. Nvir]